MLAKSAVQTWTSEGKLRPRLINNRAVRGCFELRDEGQRPLQTMLSHPGAPDWCRHKYNAPVCKPGSLPPYQRHSYLCKGGQAPVLFTAVAVAIQAVRCCTKIGQAAQQAQALEGLGMVDTVTGMLHGLCCSKHGHFPCHPRDTASESLCAVANFTRPEPIVYGRLLIQR